MPEKRVPFANTPTFYTALGLFYAAWSRAVERELRAKLKPRDKT
jgi:hypothetical protein